METVWIVLSQLVLLHMVAVESATVSAGDDRSGMLGVHNVSITCTYTLDTGESADSMTLQRRRVGEGSFGNIASFNILAGSSSYADRDLVNRADLILMDRSASVRVNNIFCNDSATYKCLFQYKRNHVLYPLGSSMVLTIEASPEGKPTFMGNLNNRLFIEGEVLQLRCGGDVGLPAGNLLWYGYKGGVIEDLTSLAEELPPLQGNSGPRYCVYRRESTLKLNLTRFHDELSIRCAINQSLHVAKPEQTCAETSCVQWEQIVVQYPVLQGDVHLSFYPSGNLITGSNVTLECMVGGNPSPTYSWVKESDVIMTMDGRKWVLTDLKLRDSGFYTCHASNIVNGTTYSCSGTIRINAGCSDGTYGLDCTEKCGKCDGVCDSVDGRCPAGCLKGYNGTKCDVVLPKKCATNQDQASSCVASLVGAVVGTFLVVLLLGVGIIICLFRQGRLSWVKNPDHKEPVEVSRDSTNMRTVDTQRDLAEHEHTYNNDYTVLDPNTAADNKDYDVIKH